MEKEFLDVLQKRNRGAYAVAIDGDLFTVSCRTLYVAKSVTLDLIRSGGFLSVKYLPNQILNGEYLVNAVVK